MPVFCAAARATRSFTVLAGVRASLTTSTLGMVVTRATYSKSPRFFSLRFLYRLWLMAWVPAVPNSSV